VAENIPKLLPTTKTNEAPETAEFANNEPVGHGDAKESNCDVEPK
jgi:hypothetical protein